MPSISIQTKTMGELPVASTITPEDILIIHDAGGVKTCTIAQLLAGAVVDIATVDKVGVVKPDGTTLTIKPDGTLSVHETTAANAGAHNAVYRGKFLGNTVTPAQYAEIAAGTFKDLYIGDYWTIGSVNYRIAAFDYYLNCGDAATTAHHVVLVPDTCLGNCQFHNTSTGAYIAGANNNVTTGGYIGSDLYQGKLYDGTTPNAFATAKTTIKAAFSGHLLSHKIYLTNAVANGRASGGAWVASEIDLMCEQMVYGSGIFSPVSDGTTVPSNYRVEKGQLPLFAHDPSCICHREIYWLRDVVSASSFVYVSSSGQVGCNSALHSLGVRPAFCIS